MTTVIKLSHLFQLYRPNNGDETHPNDAYRILLLTSTQFSSSSYVDPHSLSTAKSHSKPSERPTEKSLNLNMGKDHVITATHGKCTIDTLRHLFLDLNHGLDIGDLRLRHLLNLRQPGDAVLEDNNDGQGARANLPKNLPPLAWQINACAVDISFKILAGVKKMIDSIPEGRGAVATSKAKTCTHEYINRIGITSPAMTITADDKRSKTGKPAPDLFLLAAECLGFGAKRCVVFEDSPSGIRTGVALGATVIAARKSHPREQVQGNRAHYVVDNMGKVRCI
ncbi:hypothetical protein V5O48_010757 [Marasmius crinis-equi]|uniref:HAD-like protein n=1 Tax=Marasmius crinis-equi TaxID=585013 RepID=A0ABR3F7J0_9AGAR